MENKGEREIFLYLGDFMSFYLTILNGVDPTPIKNIERLKKQLSVHAYK